MKGISLSGIKARLLLLVGVSVAAFVGMATFGSKMMADQNEVIELLGGQRMHISETIGDIRSATNGAPRFMWLSMAYAPGTPDRKASLEKASQNLALLRTSIEKYGSYHLSDDEKVKSAEVKELTPKVLEVIEKAITALSANTAEKDAVGREILLHEMPPVAVKLTALVKELSDFAVKHNKEILEESVADTAMDRRTMLYSSVIGTLLLIGFGVFFANRLSSQLLKITESVGDASSQVSAASTQLSNAAEQLSSTSQEQASSIEETSASLTEIAGMVEANVKGAESANQCATEVHGMSAETQKSMTELADAMHSILESNQRIEKLVKVIEEIGEKTEVIDDIVFKTQLLSFNASVEAERAGEHGRGFAVVAQEVGNLAQMSGKAATEISSIVKTSIKEAEAVAQENKSRVEVGGKLAEETKGKMVTMLEQLTQILDGTSKIVSASKEQSQGVNQISSAVDAMNHATQDTASTAQESASASEELAGQAQSLLGLVNELRTIVTGRRAQSMQPKTTSKVPNHSEPQLTKSSAENVVKFQKKQPTSKLTHSSPMKKAVGAEALSVVSENSSSSGDSDAWEKL